MRQHANELVFAGAPSLFVLFMCASVLCADLLAHRTLILIDFLGAKPACWGNWWSTRVGPRYCWLVVTKFPVALEADSGRGPRGPVLINHGTLWGGFPFSCFVVGFCLVTRHVCMLRRHAPVPRMTLNHSSDPLFSSGVLAPQADKAPAVTIRTRKFLTNRLLSRKQMVRCWMLHAFYGRDCLLRWLWVVLRSTRRAPPCLGGGATSRPTIWVPSSSFSLFCFTCCCVTCVWAMFVCRGFPCATCCRKDSVLANMLVRLLLILVRVWSQIIDVLHPGRPNVPKSELKEQLSRMFKVNDNNCVFVFGFKTDFGGAKSTGFALIYDNFEQAQKYEPKYRLIRVRTCSLAFEAYAWRCGRRWFWLVFSPPR